MEYSYSNEKSKIVEFLTAPFLLYEAEEDKLRKSFINEDDFNFYLSIFNKYKDNYKTFLLENLQDYLPLNLYYLIDRKDAAIKTFDALLDAMESLSDREIRLAIMNLFNEGEDGDKKIFEVLDKANLSNEERWYFLSAYEEPKKYIGQLIEFYRYISPKYEILYEKYSDERSAFVENFDFDKFLKDMPFINDDLSGIITQSKIEVFILSSFIKKIQFELNSKYNTSWIILGANVDAYVLNKGDDLSDDSLSGLLKSLSDKSRYQVLKLISKSNMRTKDIAKSLGITSAAVSYHLSKLANDLLIVLNNVEGKDAKYSLNKERMNKLLDIIKRDFDL